MTYRIVHLLGPLMRSRSDRRAGRRTRLAAALLRNGQGGSWVGLLTGVPVALLDLIGEEQRRTPRVIREPPARRLLNIGGKLAVLACIGACVVAATERALTLSVATAFMVVMMIAYRRHQARAAARARGPARQPADRHGAGHD